jgi:hypothetical protein
MRRLLASGLAALALLLVACGGDSGGEETGRTQPTVAGESQAEGGDGGSTRKDEQGRSSNQGDVPDVQLDEDQQPVPEGSVLPQDRSGNPPSYSGGKPLPKEALKAIERPVYEQSRYLCRRLGVAGMRREYRIESSDPKDIASAVAARTYQRDIRDAVYSGCLAGLRSGKE